MIAPWLASGLVPTADSMLFTADGSVPRVADDHAGGFFGAYEHLRIHREHERLRREQAEEDAQAIADARDREIAAFLHAQAKVDAERAELERLSRLVAQFADREAEEAFSERVRVAYARAHAQQNASAMLALDRELQRQIEEEEFCVLMTLALDD